MPSRIRHAEKEIGSAVARATGGVGAAVCRVLTAEIQAAPFSAITAVEDVDTVTPELKAGVDHVPAVGQHGVVRKLNYGAAKVLLDTECADIPQGSGSALARSAPVEIQGQ